MSAPDKYWEDIGKKAESALALDLAKQGAVHRNARIAVIQKRPHWKKLREARKRGNKILCLVCMVPKPESAFSKKRGTGYVLNRCRPCNNRLSHKKRTARRAGP